MKKEMLIVKSHFLCCILYLSITGGCSDDNEESSDLDASAGNDSINKVYALLNAIYLRSTFGHGRLIGFSKSQPLHKHKGCTSFVRADSEKRNNMRALLGLIIVASSLSCYGQTFKDTVIDMHMHVYTQDERWKYHVANPVTGKPLTADNAQKHYEATMTQMKKWNYRKAVISGDTTAEWLWKKGNPELFITGLGLRGNNLPDTIWLRDAFETGKIQVFGEIAVQYDGIAPDSSILEPYYALAEEYDIPVAIHMGPGPPGAPYIGYPRYRMALSNPLLLEDVLIRHPKLRIYVMHAGWPMADAMIALMYAHPQVYVDLGAIDWARPVADFHDYLRRLVQVGFGKRIMFGSDQMVWVDAISIAIENILSAEFLTQDQKKDILYRNAKRFLKIK